MSKKLAKVILGGSNVNEFVTEAATWGELKKEVEKSMNLPNPHSAILGETKSVLIDESILPDGKEIKGELQPFHIFITPIKSKSGSVSHAEMREWIETVEGKEIRKMVGTLRNKSEEAKKFFGNYTVTPTNDLRNMLKDWFKNHPVDFSSTPVVNKPEEKVKEVKPKEKVQSTEGTILPSNTPGTKIVNTSLIDLSDPDQTLDNLIAFLQTLRNRKVEPEANKLLFTVKEVSPEDFNKMKSLIS